MRACAERHARLTGEARHADRDIDRLARFDLRQHGQRGGGGNALARHRIRLPQSLLGLRDLRTQRIDLVLLAGERL
ncbi:hypothetical protein NFI99_02315 [Burkholderia glumae]|uniref:Uncharacterized protein n=1 Tax=Burkholderia glumae TaxID=337 RepID=A0ABY5B9W3_BURGL|nr:hypothetical protein NFI99_02315 [Burkholderia glumae]